MKTKENSKGKKILQRLALAGAITLSYGLFYTQFDTKLIKDLSQKKEFVTGIDFEAYHKTESLGIRIPKPGIKEEEAKQRIEVNWFSFPSSLTVIRWMEQSFSDTLGYSPYFNYPEDGDTPDLSSKDVGTNKNAKVVDKTKGLDSLMLKQADDYLKDVISYIGHDHLLLKIRKDKNDYQVFLKENPLNYFAERVAEFASDYNKKITIELEVPSDKNYVAHEERIKLIKEVNPKLKVATSLEKDDGYDSQTGIWDPEKSRKYWENSDIIILEDYFSNPANLEKSIKNFKKASDYKKEVWVRVIVGTKRINEKKFKSLEDELADYTQSMKVAKEYADGCLADDSNGIWFYETPTYDDKDRINRTKDLFKKFRGIKLDKAN